MTFKLHARLQQDCISVGQFRLCSLLMMNDSQYPWFILVPQKSDIKEIYQLQRSERQLLMDESSYLSEVLVEVYKPDKLNIAAIGNLVPQLHIHHVVRYEHDKAWPMPVWGKYTAVHYTEQQIKENLRGLKERLGDYLM